MGSVKKKGLKRCFSEMFSPSNVPVLPDTSNIINLLGHHQKPCFMEGKEGICIKVDYDAILQELYKRCPQGEVSLPVIFALKQLRDEQEISHGSS